MSHIDELLNRAAAAPNQLAAVGWAYRDQRWRPNRWHLCADQPAAGDGREVQPVFLQSDVQPVADLLYEVARYLQAARNVGTRYCRTAYDLADLVDKVLDVHRELRMDTPEDEALRERVIAAFDTALRHHRAQLLSESPKGGDRP